MTGKAVKPSPRHHHWVPEQCSSSNSLKNRKKRRGREKEQSRSPSACEDFAEKQRKEVYFWRDRKGSKMQKEKEEDAREIPGREGRVTQTKGSISTHRSTILLLFFRLIFL
jgi:hypothetical protein